VFATAASQEKRIELRIKLRGAVKMDLDKTATLRAWLRYIDPPSYGSVVERSDEELFGGHMDDESNVYLLSPAM
jgi:hypothetical protein